MAVSEMAVSQLRMFAHFFILKGNGVLIARAIALVNVW